MISRVDLKWEELNSVHLELEGDQNFMHVNGNYKICLDCLSSNPEYVSNRMKAYYQHWKDGDFKRLGFKLPYFPKQLTVKQIGLKAILMLVCLFFIFESIQPTELIILHNEILYSLSGISRVFLFSACSISLACMLSEILDHFDINSIEEKNRKFTTYLNSVGYYLYLLVLMTTDIEFNVS